MAVGVRRGAAALAVTRRFSAPLFLFSPHCLIPAWVPQGAAPEECKQLPVGFKGIKFVAKIFPPTAWRTTRRLLPGLRIWQKNGSGCPPEKGALGAQISSATHGFKRSLDKESHWSLSLQLLGFLLLQRFNLWVNSHHLFT